MLPPSSFAAAGSSSPTIIPTNRGSAILYFPSSLPNKSYLSLASFILPSSIITSSARKSLGLRLGRRQFIWFILVLLQLILLLHLQVSSVAGVVLEGSIAQDIQDLLAVERLLLQQCLRQSADFVFMPSNQILGDDCAAVDEDFDFLVDEIAGFVGVVFHVLAFLEAHVAQLGAHPVLRDEGLCDLIGLLQVVVSAGGYSLEEVLLSTAASKNKANPVD